MALARAWPEGVPGSKHEGQTWEQLDRIHEAVLAVEKDHSVPFYPEWDDPESGGSETRRTHRMYGQGQNPEPSTVDDRNHIQEAIMVHPRSALLRRWIGYAINGRDQPRYRYDRSRSRPIRNSHR